ncbi:serine/threonine-protein kinase [Colwellia sp. MT41]|uniref:serine/threonine-protein kinase n=1 Tax=Colwellia sp. MT41 TaxID=58049 RepID=UPI00214F173F|nr:serine/threonine-protein kinase [Colwellia sp. MT41]
MDKTNIRNNLLQYIDENHEFYQEVIALINAHEKNLEQTKFSGLISEQASVLVDDEVIHQLLGTQLGYYQLTEKLGQGGMGVVYLGERNDGKLTQKVAIKFVYPSIAALAGDDFLKKEAQHLANLGHPNIAKIYTIDNTEDDVPYMVMEYIEGLAIDQYCHQNKLSLKARLALFQKVCDAVHFAHQNMIIHADIKPSNILVNELGEPKLMDFGIARTINQSIDIEDENKEVTQRYLQAVSHDFSSPEQLNGEILTSSTDVYSLARVLKKLYKNETKNRSGKEINAIIDRACAVESNLRFRSPNELSRVIYHFTEGFPIKEYSDTLIYKTRKYVSRNWIGVSLSFALLTSLLIGGGALVWQNSELREQITISNEVSGFLSSLFTAANAYDHITPQVKDLLDAGVKRVDDELIASDTIKAKLKISMANSYSGLKEHAIAEKLYLQAITHLEASIEGDSLHEAYILLADLYTNMSKFSQAEKYLDKVNNIKNKSKQVTYFMWSRYADLHHTIGEYDKALTYYKKTLNGYKSESTAKLTKIADVHNNIGLIYNRLGEYDKSVKYLQQAIDKSKKIHGDIAHPRIAAGFLNLGAVLGKQNKHQEGIRYLLKTLAIYKKISPEGHPGEGVLYNNLGAAYFKWDKPNEAQTYYAMALEKQQKTLGREHLNIAILNHNIANAQRLSGNVNSAISAHQEALSILTEIKISGPTLAIFKGGYSETLFKAKRYEDASIEIAFAIYTLKKTIPNHPKVKIFGKLQKDITSHLASKIGDNKK